MPYYASLQIHRAQIALLFDQQSLKRSLQARQTAPITLEQAISTTPVNPSQLAPIKERVVLVDVLRGFALAGIILVHNLEHYNFWHEAEMNPDWLKAWDPAVWQCVFFLFSGKAYAIFSLLFGFSFWIQYSRRAARGEPFAGRFIWRMAILLGIGTLHGFFYNGDILMLYALSSWALLLTRRWSDGKVLALAAFLLLQPWELLRIGMMFTHADSGLHHPSWEISSKLYSNQVDGSYLKMLQLNITYGHWGNFAWTWEYGRFFQAPGLFLLGMLAARRRLFTDTDWRFWLKVLMFALPAAISMSLLQASLLESIQREDLKDLVAITSSLYISLPMMLILLSSVILLWLLFPMLQKLLGQLSPFGRSSLSNYIFSNVIGTFLYWGSGLGFYHYSGATICLGIGLLMLASQVLISRFWLARIRQGPLEAAWKKATWLGY